VYATHIFIYVTTHSTLEEKEPEKAA